MSREIEQIRAAMKKTASIPAGTFDPWRDFAIAVCDSARFMALGCFTMSPIGKHREDIRQLIREVHAYGQQKGLPTQAEISLATAAMLLGVELTGVVGKPS
ncbi:MAG: hypothetical protein ACAI38_25270 [Myxococcota bacterium]